MLDSPRLQVLHRFSVCGSITATAASLGYSSSAISQQLSTLEREIGQALVERTPRSATLTDAGRMLAEHAARILTAQEEAESELAAHANTVSGRVVVNVIPNIAATVAVALAEVQQRHPQLDILMRETLDGPALHAVTHHTGDIAVVDDWTPGPARAADGLDRHELLTEPVLLTVPAAHPAAAHKGPLTRHDVAAIIADTTWLCAPEGSSSRIAGDQYLGRARTTALRQWEFEGLITMAELVANGAGCALLPAFVAGTQPGGKLCALPLKPTMTRRVQAVTRPATSHRPGVALCLRAMKTRLSVARTHVAPPDGDG